MKKKIYIITGGTMVHVSPHFSLCAPAYGKVGDDISESLSGEILDKGLIEKYEVHVLPTKMAEGSVGEYDCYRNYQDIYSSAGLSKLETNDDLSKLVDYLLSLEDTRCIVMAAAVCDFEPSVIATIVDSGMVDNPVFKFGKDQKRLSSSECYSLDIKPSEKIVSKIRKSRKDVFLVSFKTTAGVGRDETYRRGLENLKKNSSNLVFANDIKDGINMVITPEEFPYEEPTREKAIETLAEMIISRLELTFNRTELVGGEPADIQALADGGNIPENFVAVMKHLIANNAFKTFRGKTSGHFGCKVDGMPFDRISSIRKVNHNNIFQDGVAKIFRKDGVIVAEGGKPSVGEHTQQMIYDELGDNAHSIVHFHCPIREGISHVPFETREQKPFECGSNECAINCVSGIKKVEEGIWVVHLDNHGPNIAFSKTVNSSNVINFIEKYWDLSKKTGGILVED